MLAVRGQEIRNAAERIRLRNVIVGNLAAGNDGRNLHGHLNRVQGKRNKVVAVFIDNEVFVTFQAEDIRKQDRPGTRNRKCRAFEERDLRI